jgi:hypothetical protein
VISGIFKRGEHESDDASDQRPQDLAVGGSEPAQGIGGRTLVDVSPTSPDAGEAEARLIPQDLLARLRSYLKLRATVMTYLKVQPRRDWLALRLTRLQKAGAKPNVDFWEELQAEFSGMGLRSEVSIYVRLLEGEFFVDVDKFVNEFDALHAKVAAAAEAALNPNQSAKSAETALQDVSEMLRIGRKLAEKCQEEAYALLEDLNTTVTEIFAGEERSAPVEDRGKDIGRVGDLKPAGSTRAADDSGGRQKQLSGTGAGPDVSGQIWRSKGAP